MRLGDLDALKESIQRYMNNAWLIPCNEVLKRIDSAPAVETEITNDDLQAAMTESYRLGYELAETKFKRPQGEWINEWQEIEGGRTYGACCSLCHINGHSGYKFCPNCGADMRGAVRNE